MSDERKYYCFCEANCKHETMTKEQILASIAQLLDGGAVYDPDAAIVSKVKESNAGQPVTFWRGTAAQYNAIAQKDPNCFYIITDDTTLVDLSRTIEEINVTAAQARGAADAALSTVNSANETANAALAAASSAQSAAGSAQTTANSANTTAKAAQTTANSANTTAKAALPKAGGAMTGYITTKGIKLTSGTDYGSTLPTTGTAGRLFFKKV